METSAPGREDFAGKVANKRPTIDKHIRQLYNYTQVGHMSRPNP